MAVEVTKHDLLVDGQYLEKPTLAIFEAVLHTAREALSRELKAQAWVKNWSIGVAFLGREIEEVFTADGYQRSRSASIQEADLQPLIWQLWQAVVAAGFRPRIASMTSEMNKPTGFYLYVMAPPAA